VSEKPIVEIALRLYDLMDEQADEDKVWRGSITGVFGSLGVSMSYYSPATKLLTGIGAIVLLQRGARGIDSEYKLMGRPDNAELDGVQLTTRRSAASVALEQRITDMEKRIGRLDIVEALSNLEKRVRALELDKESNGT
jgi:hypothetical protein